MLDAGRRSTRPSGSRRGCAGRDGLARARPAARARAVHAELLIAEPVRPPGAARDKLGAEHVAIEGVRALPVGDCDDRVVEDHTEIPYASVNASLA